MFLYGLIVGLFGVIGCLFWGNEGGIVCKGWFDDVIVVEDFVGVVVIVEDVLVVLVLLMEVLKVLEGRFSVLWVVLVFWSGGGLGVVNLRLWDFLFGVGVVFGNVIVMFFVDLLVLDLELELFEVDELDCVLEVEDVLLLFWLFVVLMWLEGLWFEVFWVICNFDEVVMEFFE